MTAKPVVSSSRCHIASLHHQLTFRLSRCFSDTESILTNKRAKRSDQGTYQIKLSNPVGYDTATCRVSVVDRPTAPLVSPSDQQPVRLLTGDISRPRAILAEYSCPKCEVQIMQ